jgi:hypothetical protein
MAGPFPMVWEALADGSVVDAGLRRRQGTWKEDGDKVEIEWEDGRTISLRKRGSSFVGEDHRGNAIELEPAA